MHVVSTTLHSAKRPADTTGQPGSSAQHAVTVINDNELHGADTMRPTNDATVTPEPAGDNDKRRGKRARGKR